MPPILAPINQQVLFFENYTKHSKILPILKEVNSVLKIIRRFNVKYFPKVGLDKWYNEQFKSLPSFIDSIIIFDSFLSVPAANYLKRKYPNLRLIYWFWNHIYDINLLNNLNPDIEKWSYDPIDCQKYGLKYNSQFYFNDFSVDYPYSLPKWDFLFVGAEKGRGHYIKECRDLITKYKFSYNFIVSGNSRKERIKNWIPYNDLVKLIYQSRCIVDIVPAAQNGLTLRPLEAVFHNKKLITNFVAIENMDFYNPSNIFIIGKDSENFLSEFMEIPLTPVPTDIREYYLFENWLRRFN